MTKKFVAILAPALALGFLAVTAGAQQHKATRLGNPATRFAKPLKKADDLRVLLRADAMKADVQKEHLWLQKLIGDWTFEAECMTGPDQPPTKTRSSNTARSLGGLWTLVEGEGESPDGTVVKSIITLGYDPAEQRFVGSFIASCMTHL